MALETNTLVNGAWTTRTLDVNAVLRHYDQQDKEANAKAADIEKAPALGLLTQTVIRSPLAHWILPVRLRDPLLNDVALVGDNFIQIKELRNDGHLWDVTHKENFGARIRNAKVVGSLKAYDRESNSRKGNIFGTQIKDEDDYIEMDDRADPGGAAVRRNADLPPQCILIQLDTGDSVFLMVQQTATGGWEFISNRHRVSKSMIKLQAGTHLAVDPSSRYMAIGCSEGNFVIYELSSREELKRQYSESSDLRYIQGERHVFLQGTIHKMEFLYPSADDDEHVILLVLFIKKGKTRMLIYEWQTGDNLRNVHAHSRNGHQLEESHQMPLLVIPLTIQSSFIIVSEAVMAVCKNILLGSPNIFDFNSVIEPPTPFHHGCGPPLWTAWTRPIRRLDHAAEHDDIYIVREDGQVNHLELHSGEDNLIGSFNIIGTFQSNCGTALASLDYHGYEAATRGDLLITGGDSCGGGAYLIQARSEPKFQQNIQNWSPAQDIVTTSREQDRDSETSNLPRQSKLYFPKSDKMYSCVGKGLKGAVVEFRQGLEAHIGLEMEFHTPIMDVWALPSISDAGQVNDGSDFLLSLGDCSVHLRLAGDAGAVYEKDQASSPFDLKYRTLTAFTNGAHRIQVTEKSIVFIDRAKPHIQDGDELLSIYEGNVLLGHGQDITTAVIHENLVLFTICLGDETFLQIKEPLVKDTPPGSEVSNSQLGMRPRTLGRFSTRVTSLTACLIGQVLCAIVAHWTGQSTILSIHPIDGANSHSINIPVALGDGNFELEQFVSIAASYHDTGSLVLLCGTSNGLVIMLQINEDDLEIMDYSCERVGATPAVITRDEHSSFKELFFLNCDSKLYAFSIVKPPISSSCIEREKRERTLDQIWFTDVTNPKRQQPQINSVSRLPVSTSTGIINGILLVDGSQLLVAGLGTQSMAVPRYMPIGGTPSRLLFSESLDALIVGATVNGKSTLIFLDPVTGEDISMPFDKNRNIEVDFVSGLGTENERIFRLLEWSYVKDGTTWNFIIVCTSTGRFLMISAVQDVNEQNVASASRPRIRYWTRYRWKCENPIYSAIGFSDGIFYCSGKTLYCETLDITEKKFKPLAQYELPSPALNLTYENGIIYALTSIHSLEVLKLVNSGPGAGIISKFVRTHGDQVTRSSLHNRLIGRTSKHPLHLISDKTCSVVGLWATNNTRADTLEEIFEAELPYSILRFRSGNCRPVWDQTWFASGSGAYNTTNSKAVRNSAEYPQVFGLAIDGSVCHFTVLDFSAWSFLRFLVNLALQSPKVCEFTYREHDVSKLQPVTEPKIMMHVDGDILKRCLEGRYLEELLSPQRSEEEAKVKAKFRELLEAMHHGNLGKSNSMRVLINRAYEDLEFFLRPVL